MLCSITPEALGVVNALDGPMNQLDETSLEMLDEQEQRTLIALLDAIRQGQP